MVNVFEVSAQPHLFQDDPDSRQRQNVALCLLGQVSETSVQELELQTDPGTVCEDPHPSHDPTLVWVQNSEAR